jgi:hypothetical protein
MRFLKVVTPSTIVLTRVSSQLQSTHNPLAHILYIHT